MAKILIIDDERSIRKALREILEFEKYKIEEAEDGAMGLDLFKKNNFDLVMCDIKMPRMDGNEFLAAAQELKPEIPVVLISGHGTIEVAVEAIKNGAYDFIAKPPDLNRILVTVRNALERKDLVVETKNLRKQITKSKATQIIGKSTSLRHILELIEKVAPTDARVLITGENGTGKELIAARIHELSARNSGPFIEVNCAAIPPELIESELFGHEKGAFTSAIKQRIGKFEQAQGGTLFLDEIGDMSLNAQAKVLRALQENKITRVGGEKDIRVDVRIIAATNKNLLAEIEEKNFREDLYHRLGVILIKNPALRDRKDDIPLLVDYFLTQICAEYGTKKKQIDKDAIELLMDKQWRGNIRELRNVVERLVILSGEKITHQAVNQFVI